MKSLQLLGIGLGMVALTVQAASDVSGSTDHPLLDRYPRAYITNYEQRQEPDYRWALGALENVRGRVEPEKLRRLSGTLTRISYRIPDGVGPDEAFEYMQNQLLNKEAAEVFSCQGRQCGSSNEWANEVFDYARLYGVERTQYYGAFQFGDTAVSVYSVQRGNRRVYLHLDLLQPEKTDLVDQLRRQGYVRWPDGDDPAQLVAYLKKQDRPLWLVGHSRKQQPPQASIEQSRQLAQQVAEQLIDAGVEAERLQVFGVGALVPSAVKPGQEAVFIIQQ
ncbi:DUF4892 domain-containing protein [Marinobacterium arenosum]|uniref:DUF4892 domain-containing protein n=1 Tax=Marinobacterium arenosum TaxID=2862496 RepID=UPI001C98B2DD|nr:DUF4892 domain-containing protein [Marinobacterium arenosum]MBY4678709.1 DUF4892 domain-containing protein [Marinobacterium arenosum]